MEALWDFFIFVFFTIDHSVVRADPGTAVLAVAAVYGAIEGQDQARRARKQEEEAKKAAKAREAELAAEAAAKEAAKKKAETAGQRAGFGAGAPGGAPTRSTFTAAAQAGTGFSNTSGSEDNISRGTLFGN